MELAQARDANARSYPVLYVGISVDDAVLGFLTIFYRRSMDRPSTTGIQ